MDIKKQEDSSSDKTAHLGISVVIKRIIKLIIIPMFLIYYNIIAIVFIISIPYWIITGKTLVKPLIDLNNEMFKFMES